MSWGTVNRERGRWRARAGDRRRTHIGYYATREDALAAVSEAYRVHALSLHASGRTAALVAFGRAWLDREARTRRGLAQERSRFEAHIARAPFAEWPIAMIGRREVQNWVRELARGDAQGPRGGPGRRRKRATVQRVLSLLRVILRAAVEAGIVDDNAADGVTVPGRAESETEEWLMLSAAEVELLRTTEAIPLHAHSAFVVGAFTGLRPGELWGLRWSDVHAAELVVRSSRGGPTKGGRVRRVPLLEPAAEILDRWRAASRPGRLGLVWPSRSGGHYAAGHDAGWQDRPQTSRAGCAYVQFGYRWRAGISTRCPLKDLRHTCASHLLRGTWVAAGWIARPLRMEEVSQWLGHASLEVTQRYYARLAPGGLLDVVPARRHLRAITPAQTAEQGGRNRGRSPEGEAG